MTFKKGETPRHEGDVLEEERTKPIIARFQLADIPSRGQWLLTRLSQRWPHISEATFSGRLRAWIGSNGHHFIKGAHGVALFRLVRAELDPLPYVEEVFLFTREPKTISTPSERDALGLYREAARWGKTLGATKVIICRVSDHIAQMVKLLDAAEHVEKSIVL